jgi:RNA polymerase sigma-70 factor (ECF subfamily)
MSDGPRSGRLTEAGLCDLFQDHREGLAGAVRSILGARSDAQTLVQDAFMKALRALRRGVQPRDPAAWIFVVTMNLAKDRRRRAQRRAPTASLEELNGMELTAKDPPPVARLEAAETMAAARAAIARLGDSEKEVFLLRVAGDLTFEAAAAALGIPVGTAKTRMRSALARLRRQLSALAPRQGEREQEDEGRHEA